MHPRSTDSPPSPQHLHSASEAGSGAAAVQEPPPTRAPAPPAGGEVEQPRDKAPPPRGGSFLLSPVAQDIFTRERFSEEQREIDQMVRDFARERILPHKDDLGHLDRELSLTLMREVGELGLTGVDIPERYGGLGLDKTTSALVVEALTTGGSASWIVTFSAHVGIGTLPIVFFGSDELKERYLPKLATVEALGAYALTEPGSGSDAGALKTTARLTDDGEAYILNGSKQFVTNGGWADVYIVFAAIDGSKPTAFVMDGGSEGLTIGAEEHKMGIKGSSTTSLTLDNVRIPKENVLGEPGDGMHIALNILNIGRFKLGAADLGGCKSLITQATGYALERQQFGQPIAFFDAIRKKLAEMVVRTFMLDSAIYRTVGLMDAEISRLDPDDPTYPRRVMDALEEYAIEASMAKILGSEVLSRVADHGVQIYGGYGFSEEYPMAEAYRDCRIDRIFEGTNEINRMVIYGYYLKKGLMEELPMRSADRGWSEEPEIGEGEPWAWEMASLETVRRLTVKCLVEAVNLYGQDLRNEQIVGEDLADLAMGFFAASSALNRIRQLDAQGQGNGARRDPARAALARLVVATLLEDAWVRFYRLRPVLFSGPWGGRFAEAFDRRLAALNLPFDPVPEVRTLTDDLYRHRRYRFE